MRITNYNIENLIADVNGCLNEKGLWECEASFKRFADSPALFENINKKLEELILNPCMNSAAMMSNGLVLHAEPGWSLMQSIYEHSSDHLYTIPFDGLITPALHSNLIYSVYKLPENYKNNIFEHDCKLTEVGTFEAKHGDVIRIESKKYVYDINILHPLGALRLYTSTYQDLQWAFDRETLLPVQAISSTENASEITLIMQVLAKLGNQYSVDLIKQIALSHPQHFVRWEAVKAIAQIDPHEGKAAVERALGDSHPHIVAAANRTITRYQERKQIQ